MTPVRWVSIFSVACIAWIPATIYLGRVAAQDQDAAGRGLYSAITTFVLLIIGGISLGIPALRQAKRLHGGIRFCAHIAAWLILLSPLLVAGAAIIPEFFGDPFRPRP